jgi:hypothetical protein
MKLSKEILQPVYDLFYDEGGEKEVFRLLDDDDHLLGVYRDRLLVGNPANIDLEYIQNCSLAKSVYYISAILRIFFPNNIVKIHFAGVYKERAICIGDFIKQKDNYHKTTSQLDDELLKIGYITDKKSTNYRVDQDNNLIYLDIGILDWMMNINYIIMQKAINNLPEDTRPKAQRYFERLLEYKRILCASEDLEAGLEW